MRLWMDVETVPGTKIGAGPIEVISASTTARLSKAGQWQATVPGLDPRALSLLQPQRTALIYAEQGGHVVYVGGGPISEVTASLNDKQATLQVTGVDLLGELAFRTMPDAATDDGMATALARIPAVWTVIPNPYLAKWSARYARESVLNALLQAADRMNFSFALAPTTANPRTLNFVFDLPASILLATANAPNVEADTNVCAITSISERRSSLTMANRIYAYGSGNGDARFTLANAVQWPVTFGSTATPWTDPYGNVWTLDKVESRLDCTSAQATQGIIETAIQFSDIAPVTNNVGDMQIAAYYLLYAALAEGAKRVTPQKTYSLSVAGVRRPLRPGDYINVECRRFVDGERPIDIAGMFRVLEVVTSYDGAGVRADRLTVSTFASWPQTDEAVVAAAIAQVQAMNMHPQMAASVDTISYTEPFDDDNAAALYFWLGNEIAAVHQAQLRYRVDPMRSPVRGTAVTGTVTIPTHQHAVPNHGHDIPVQNVVAGTGFAARVFNNAGNWELGAEAMGGGHNLATAGGTGATTAQSGGGQSNLNLDLSSALTYGIYEDPNAYGPDDIEWLLNGVLVTGARTSAGGGWYAIDVTALVADPITLRPLAASWTLTGRVPSARQSDKRGQVTAQVTLRTVVQAIRVAG